MFWVKIKTFFDLGVFNILRVLIYKLSLKLELNPACCIPKQLVSSGIFFREIDFATVKKISDQVFSSDDCSFLLFGHLNIDIETSTPPDWHLNILTKKRSTQHQSPWWKISDFNQSLGDIKGIWEISRFTWVVLMVKRALLNKSGDLTALNIWLKDWNTNNPPNLGINWKCGQEASIRVLHLGLAAHLTNQAYSTEVPLLDFVEQHLKRIAPTTSYAKAQDNNHAISEAAALYIGGLWLTQNGRKNAKKYLTQGLALLEERSKKLIAADGSFSQHSLTYHRLLLDVLNLTEIWRKHYDPQRKWSPVQREKNIAAANWLFQMIDPSTGDGPNLGANDGANLTPVAPMDYRDFRPTVQLAFALFKNEIAYDCYEVGKDVFKWLDLSPTQKTTVKRTSQVFPDGGYATIVDENVFIFLRYPCFRFRPSQSDLLHLDLWINSKNILRDSGTYSYMADSNYYFSSVEAHNTIAFDEHDQMPRLSRFLFGAWPSAQNLSTMIKKDDGQNFSVAYTDYRSCYHQRDVKLMKGKLIIADSIKGFKSKACLRWHLPNLLVKVENLRASFDNINFDVSTKTTTQPQLKLKNARESRFYYHQEDVKVLELELTKADQVTTVIEWPV